MFDTTFFKFLLAFVLIIGFSSVMISYVGGLHTTSTGDTQTAQSTQ